MAHPQTAIDRDDGTGDVARIGGGEERHHRCDLVGRGHASERHGLGELGETLLAERRGHVGLDGAAALGENDFCAPGVQYGDYENAIGTSQVHVWFDRPSTGWTTPPDAA